VGIFAAGPYACAQGLVTQALYSCMDDQGDIDMDVILLQVRTGSGVSIDSVSNLKNAPVYLFHGQSDATVKQRVADANAQFYSAVGADVVYDNSSLANHEWVSPLGINECSISSSPFISNCGSMDPQYSMLSHLLQSDVNAPNTGSFQGTIYSFSQDVYSTLKWGIPAADVSMDSTGYVYVPPTCAENANSTDVLCDVVLVLHGCEQGAQLVGLDLIMTSNMNNYADTNNLIILYPQTIMLETPAVLNPKGCWNW